MTGWEVRELLLDAGVIASCDGDRLILEHFEGKAVAPAVVELARSHKAVLLDLLRFEARADALVLAVFDRLARAWRPGMPIHTPDHDALEAELAAAYRSLDLDHVVDVLRRWESAALKAFEQRHEEAPR